jgi:YgiT-type zinc finger domain-containing protein
MRKECPMCGESMVLTTRSEAPRIPGTTEIHITETREWLCQECDYFEEADDDEREKRT